ncbi:MAG: phosphate acetyltransferase [Nanoarchaeota archaeon]|nr:phosphate acetyltransferase [Nanoarchaeota archaeon]MBU1322311.1 phosphate acetyltransferase [Nanoarchaeota archaeon]MBU1597850.1 phosphate acetyltransferase [Nanoarchaeota archaeon]MBU2441437.1 phosphate acetyltransferase [Nanoarchaeota archaeon]
MKEFMNNIKAKAKQNPKTIVFPEGTEERILRAAEKIIQQGIAGVILIGDENEIKSKANELGVNIEYAKIINPNTFEKFDEYANAFFEMRKHKGITLEQAKETMSNLTYFGTMLVHMGEADGLVSGSTHSTADTVRPALQIIKTKEEFHKVSSFFFMLLEDKLLIFADCAIIIDPDVKTLAEIAIDTANNARKFGINPKVAMLSFSTKGSAKHAFVDKVIEATALVKEKMPDLIVDGEMQVDAALVPHICEKKCKDCDLKGDANVLIFPDLQSGNIAYKLVERLAKANAVGPILQGLNKPVNDLSRGCSVQDVIDVTAITVVEAQGA